jgi:hypothetical protein
MWGHIRILLHSTVTDGDFASEIEAYRLGPLKHNDTETRIWFQLSTKKNAQLPDCVLDGGQEPQDPSAASAAANKKQSESRDIMIELKMAQLLEIVQKDDGYYCTVGLRADSKPAVCALVSAAERHLAANVADAKALQLESPFRHATEEDLAGGIVERMLCKVPQRVPHGPAPSDDAQPCRARCPARLWAARPPPRPAQPPLNSTHPQISVFAGRMTATKIQSKDSKRLLGPGDSAAELLQMAPLGYCNASIHLMGFWHNERVFSPVIYLSTAQLTAPPLPLKMVPEPVAVHSPVDIRNPLRRLSRTETPDIRLPPPSGSTRQLLYHDETYDAGDSVLVPTRGSSRSFGRTASPHSSPPSFRSMRGKGSFMSQASTAEAYDSEEETEMDRDITPPTLSPKKFADTSWVTCGPRADADWNNMPAKTGKTPAIMRPVQLLGDKAMRVHPNPAVRSLFKN